MPTPTLEGFLRDFETGGFGAGWNLVLFESLNSTNGLARTMVSSSLARSGVVRPFVVAALEQVAGRGRLGRSWSSPRGRGAYVSLVAPGCSREALSSLPLLVGVGLCRGLAPLVPVPCRLKWPNDLMVGGDKIGGILIETVAEPGGTWAAVIGFGVNQTHRREDLPISGATSLVLSGGRSLPLGELAGRLVASLESEIEHLDDVDYAIASYEELTLHSLGDTLSCRTSDRTIEGSFAGFDRFGRLRLESAAGLELISSGDVWSAADDEPSDGRNPRKVGES